MALSEIAGLAATVDGQGRSDVADAAAAAWGLPAGAARFWRSSASHVFAVREPIAAYLRLVPPPVSHDRLAAVAELMARLGPWAAAPVRSRSGQLVETVATSRGSLHAMLVTAAPGQQVDSAGLTPSRARAWGAALARLHRCDAGGSTLPEFLTSRSVDGAGELVDRELVDEELVGAMAGLRTWLDRLPRDGDHFGLVHGDFELDNLAWVGDTPTAYDFDGAGRGWFMADIAQALGDVLPPGAAVADVPVASWFVAGYRGVRALPDADLANLPLFRAALAAAWLVRLPHVLDLEPSPADPAWLTALRAKLTAHGAHLRTLVLSDAPQD